jgi:hypothetical protein
MVESLGGHGVHAHGQYDAFRPVHRWLYVAADGSALIREIAGPYSFFTPDGKARWEAAGSPLLREGLNDDVYGPGRFSGTQSRLVAGRHDPATASALLAARPPRTLKAFDALLGETILPADVRQTCYELAGQLPGVETLTMVSDQLGRPGRGFAENDENGYRLEVIFADDYEMLGYQRTLLTPDPDWDYAPPGTLVSWTAYVTRQWTDQLPADSPPIPHND